jgi:ATP-binding cassette subfamily B protein
MVGHRTRIEQEAPDQWHRGEDELLDQYLDRSRSLDRASAALEVLVPGGWLVFGLACLAPAFLLGTPSAGLLAVSVGGVLASQLALEKLSAGLASVSAFAISWQKVGGLFRAAAREEPLGAPGFDPSGAPGVAAGDVFLSARDLAFRFGERQAPVLAGCSLDVRAGDRILMEGESGGGKSTFGSLLLGLREPTAGLVLLRGLDRSTWGAEQWRRQVAAAPQFHENHIFAGTLAFNLLLARRWPPTEADLREAEEVCLELGLGELLERMPAGLQEQVGETGWRLSHGERSRIFVARALLQDGSLLVLDESFAALDPKSLRSALECTLRRAPSLLVIAHP